MYTYIGVKSDLKDFDIFPLETSVFNKDEKNFYVYINGHKDSKTPYEVHMYFKDGDAYSSFVEGMESKNTKKALLLASWIRESTVHRVNTEQAKAGIKAPYLKWVFKGLELYY